MLFVVDDFIYYIDQNKRKYILEKFQFQAYFPYSVLLIKGKLKNDILSTNIHEELTNYRELRQKAGNLKRGGFVKIDSF